MSVEPNKWGVIYNPKAGTRKVQKRWKEIKAYMDSKGVSYDYVQSEGFGSVERLAGILANNGYRTIVIVGFLAYTIGINAHLRAGLKRTIQTRLKRK